MKEAKQTIKPIAFYLPQYHPIPENDAWWGKGFTEWTNVRKSQPRFPGHYQPHVPNQLGYYDLRDPAVRQAQAELAREYGIHGFCYYHYWFNGKRLLETPFNEVLRLREPDFPFCICWANENWTRRWDGHDQQVLMAQEYGDEDDLAFITNLIPAFRDDRYIRVNGKPLLIVYRTGLLPDPKRTAEIWRQAMHRAGEGDLYLVRVENGMDPAEPKPEELGYDAAVEFAPYWRHRGPRVEALGELGLSSPSCDDLTVYSYDHCMHRMLSRPLPSYKLFRGIFPSWDNSCRRKSSPVLFIGSTPAKYAFWLSLLLTQTAARQAGDERLVFINAWNEWGEGCHLEPDFAFGTGYLEATRAALSQADELSLLLSPGSSVADQDPTQIDRWFAALLDIHGQGRSLDDREKLVIRSFANVLAAGGIIQPASKDLDFHIEQLTSELRGSEKAIKELKNSLSWRLTAPLRTLAGLIHRGGSD